jgi:hypothetical protein
LNCGHLKAKSSELQLIHAASFVKENLNIIFLGQEMVGNYSADFYVINGMVLETRKRREHLSTDDLRKNKALLENFAKGNAEYLEQQNGKPYF